MRILITGVGGQDGQILASQLINQDYEVFGICRENHSAKLATNLPQVELLIGDLTQTSFVEKTLNKVQPDVIYNLAGFSSVRNSWAYPNIAIRINSELPAQLMSWCISKSIDTKFIQASSSEIFGLTDGTPQSEESPLRPTTPYGLSKVLAHNLIQQFRELYKVKFSSAILFNHESIYRSEHFVLRHITASVARISAGLQNSFEIGDLAAERDWGWAPDYVVGLQKIAQLSEGNDYVFSSGELHSVKEIIEICFEFIGIDNYEKYLVSSPELLRTKDHKKLVGNSGKAITDLEWKHTHNFKTMVQEILKHDLNSCDLKVVL